MNALVLHQPEVADFDELEDALLGAFRALIAQGETPSVVVLRAVDVAAHGEPVAAALAYGLLGLVRALALESFNVNALCIEDDAEAGPWIDRLADPRTLNGQLIRLDARGRGRISP